jgi:prepilin-type N-terminal cleavage/methylation domain-containing protein
MNQISRHNKGFTLIELVTVIVLLGILSATALPRFVDITEDAEMSVTKTVRASLASGLKMVQLKATVKNNPASLIIAGNTVNLTANGWPYSQAGNAQGCIDIWNALLESPPSIVAWSASLTTSDWSARYLWTVCFYHNHNGNQYDAVSTPYFQYYPLGNGDGSVAPGGFLSFNME